MACPAVAAAVTATVGGLIHPDLVQQFAEMQKQTKEFQDIEEQLHQIDLTLTAQESNYSVGLGKMATAYENCCNKKEDFYETLANEKLYVDYPHTYTDDQGNTTTVGVVSDYHSAIRASADQWKAAHDADLEFAKDKHQTMELPYWIQMTLALIATIQGIELYNQFMGILNDIMRDVRNNCLLYTSPSPRD